MMADGCRLVVCAWGVVELRISVSFCRCFSILEFPRAPLSYAVVKRDALLVRAAYLPNPLANAMAVSSSQGRNDLTVTFPPTPPAVSDVDHDQRAVRVPFHTIPSDPTFPNKSKV